MFKIIDISGSFGDRSNHCGLIGFNSKLPIFNRSIRIEDYSLRVLCGIFLVFNIQV